MKFEDQNELDDDILDQDIDELDDDLENQGVTEEGLENDEDDLQEFKASFGDPSEIPEPVGTKTPKRRGDKDGKQAAHVPNKIKQPPKVTKEDIDVDADVAAIFNGSDLSEDFQDKAKVVYEAAVVATVNSKLEEMAESIIADSNDYYESLHEEFSEKTNSYLDYVVEEWMTQNELAIERGVRSEMTEDFLTGLKRLFDENYITIPEEKVDVVEELVDRVENLENELAEATNNNVALTESIKVYEKELTFAECVEDLSENQADKLHTLAESIDYVSEDDFKEKLSMMKQQYFNIEESVDNTTIIDDVDDEDPISLEEEKEVPTGTMALYADAISRQIKK